MIRKREDRIRTNFLNLTSLLITLTDIKYGRNFAVNFYLIDFSE